MMGRSLNSFSLLDELNELVDWAGDNVTIDLKSPYEYVGWKLPFPRNLLDDDANNRAFKMFCVQMMLSKQQTILAQCRNFLSNTDFCRVYVILTRPNLFASEVGIAFSKSKWESMLFRNIETETYAERTFKEQRSLRTEFAPVVFPHSLDVLYFQHEVKDSLDDIHFKGGFFALWQDVIPN